MPDRSDAPKKNPQHYQIAEPLSYSAFSLDPSPLADTELRVAGVSTERAPHESWDDTGKISPRSPRTIELLLSLRILPKRP